MREYILYLWSDDSLRAWPLSEIYEKGFTNVSEVHE